jgi:myo-inositol 2-dehydrogenase / D-chiro-inositol 1-dehydrogenase
MKAKKEFTSRALALSPVFAYVQEEDRYLFAREKPKHRFNIIGTGVNGQEHILVTLLEGRAAVHGIYDTSPYSAAAARAVFNKYAPKENLVVYDSLYKACNDPAVDGLIISTPNFTHIDIMQTAIKSGKNILLEKPMATTIHDAYAITQLGKDYSAVLQVGLQYRYKAIYVEAIQEALVRKSIGDIRTINILEHRFPFLDKVNQWNKFSRFSGGTLVEKCCHYFDLFNMFAQSRPVSVYATGSQAVNFLDFEIDGMKSDILDNAFVIVKYANGITACFSLVMFAPMFHEEMVLCGDRGRLKVTENNDSIGVPRPNSTMEIMLGEDKPSRISTPSYPSYIEETGHHGATFYEHVNFIDRIEGKPTNAATTAEGFWSIVVGSAAEESVKTGKVVEINELLQRNGLDL